MKPVASFFTAIGTACLFAACSTVVVSTDYDHTAPFGRYRSYSLAPAAQGEKLSAVGEAALRDTLRSQLAKRGISEAPHAKADLDVVRHAILQSRTSVQRYTDWGYGYNGAWPYGYGYYSMWVGAPVTYVDVQRYTEGTLIIDFVDRRTKRLVFRGTGTAVVEGAESNARKIEEAVEKIVAQFPVGAKP